MTGESVRSPVTDREFKLGVGVRCSDGECGHLTELIVDPHTWMLTHVVVEPTHRSGLGRLVPVSLLDYIDDATTLRCSLSEFAELASAERTGLVPGSNGGYGGYGLGQAVPGPYSGRSSFGVLGGTNIDAFDPVVYDTPPVGEVPLHDVAVHATDGDIGHVESVVVNSQDHRVTKVVLREGHLWGHRRVTIPISAIGAVGDGIQLTITKAQVKELPMKDEISGP